MRKSADALSQAGHDVMVLYAHNTAWADQADKPILEGAKWSHVRVGGSPNAQRLRFHWGRVERKLHDLTGNSRRAFCRGYREYVRLGKQRRPDLLIGHNPGALGPLVTLANTLWVPALFDAEDFHRGEQQEGSKASKDVARLENELLPHVDALTAASPLIAAEYRALFPSKVVTDISNAFSIRYASEQPKFRAPEEPLRLVWFSQVIGTDRGLVEFIEGMNGAANVPIEFSIVGQCASPMRESLRGLVESEIHQLTFFEPMNEEFLFNELSKNDLGLALEGNDSFNRQICETNKLYSYPLAGCGALISSTSGQRHFLDKHPDVGLPIDLQNPENIADTLRRLHENRLELLSLREGAWTKAHSTLNWEMESAKLVQLVEQMLEA